MSNSNETEMNIAAEMKAHKEAETEGSKGRCLLSMSDLSLCVCHASILLLSSPHFIHYSQLCTACVRVSVCVCLCQDRGRER